MLQAFHIQSVLKTQAKQPFVHYYEIILPSPPPPPPSLLDWLVKKSEVTYLRSFKQE